MLQQVVRHLGPPAGLLVGRAWFLAFGPVNQTNELHKEGRVSTQFPVKNAWRALPKAEKWQPPPFKCGESCLIDRS